MCLSVWKVFGLYLVRTPSVGHRSHKTTLKGPRLLGMMPMTLPRGICGPTGTQRCCKGRCELASTAFLQHLPCMPGVLRAAMICVLYSGNAALSLQPVDFMRGLCTSVYWDLVHAFRPFGHACWAPAARSASCSPGGIARLAGPNPQLSSANMPAAACGVVCVLSITTVWFTGTFHNS